MYGKIENNILVQKQVNQEDGFIPIPDTCVCGDILCADGSFVTPIPVDNKTYIEKRAAEYPHIGDQLDAIMKWVAGEKEITVTPELKSIAMQCMSVKAKYPKPSEK